MIGRGLLALTIVGACQSPSVDATDLVRQSIEVHGGLQAYRQLDSLSWLKTTRLWEPDGSLESEKTQLQTFVGGESPSMILSWRQDSTFYQIESNRSITRYRMGDVILSQGEEVEQAKKLARSAAYVFFQPFKLLDTGTALLYEGDLVLGDTLPVQVVRVGYMGDDENSDIWRYYFDDNKRLVANSVEHNNRISLIVNLSYQRDPDSGLLLNRRRKSYFVDSLLQINYQRADYLYELQ